MSHFNEILTTLGASDIEVIRENTKWELWKAVYRTPVSSVVGYYLYIKYKCPLKEASSKNINDWKTLCGGSNYEVVVTPKSIFSDDLKNTQAVFQATRARTSKQLLWDNFLTDIKWMPLSTEEYFVEPSLEVSDGTTVSDSLKYLHDWLINKDGSRDGSGLALLSADGGVGKTTVSRKLCEMIHKLNPLVLPILIESDQWKHLIQSTVTLETLWDLALSRRFEQAGALISNGAALRALIHEGVFVIIFDGFDELCAAGHTPKEIIDELSSMVYSDDNTYNARILITSRETFWGSIKDEIDPGLIEVFHLRGFNNDQKKKFFKNRLKDNVSRDLALRMSKQIGGALYTSVESEELNEERPSGVPFILSLIAAYVEDNPEAKYNVYAGDPLEGLLLDICKRENKRQGFKIEPEAQMTLFEELFREYQNEFTLEDLKTFLAVICDVTEVHDIQQFTQHAFIEMRDQHLYGAKYEVLRVYFVARFLAAGISDLTQKGHRKDIAKLLALQSTGKTQVLDWLLIQLKKLEEPVLLEAIHHANVIINDAENIESRKDASKALFYISTSFVPEEGKSERAARLKVLLSYGGDKHVYKKVVFAGMVRNFSFEDMTFDMCSFHNVEFKNCKFNSNTYFNRCVFDGILSLDWCDGEEDVVLKDCDFSKEAEYVWNNITKTGVSESVRIAFAEEILERALRKFKGGLGFKGIQKRHSKSGFRKGNPYVDQIWPLLLKHKIVEAHIIAGVDQGGYHLTEDKQVRNEITQYLDNGVLGKSLRGVMREISQK